MFLPVDFGDSMEILLDAEISVKSLLYKNKIQTMAVLIPLRMMSSAIGEF